MPYNLVRLAPGSYDVLLDGVIVASLVQCGESRQSIHHAIWTVELLLNLPPSERPAPFTEIEHTFSSLEKVQEWLGITNISEADGEV
jgi:hypothetical protein